MPQKSSAGTYITVCDSPSHQKGHILTERFCHNDSLDMNEALCSILCKEDEWCFDAEGRSIKFNEDGTGEVCMPIPVPLRWSLTAWKLWCKCNLNYWICAELEWKSVKPLDRVEPPCQIVGIAAATRNKTPRLLGELRLEITLTKRLPRRVLKSPFPKLTIIWTTFRPPPLRSRRIWWFIK